MTFIKTDLTGYSKINSGSYTGNNTVNRAIAHGLGVTPKYVILSVRAGGWGETVLITSADIMYHGNAGDAVHSVTIPDSTNFYVGNATNYTQTGNANGNIFHWVAFG